MEIPGNPYRDGKAEIIVYKGIKFRRYPDSKRFSDRNYFKPNSKYIKLGVSSLHREIWRDAHGQIPENHEIHHIDENPLNNDIANLECLHKKRHYALHAEQYPEWKKEWLRTRLRVIRDKAANWHGSEEGLAWHSENGKRVWLKAEYHDYICQHCGGSFQSRMLEKDRVKFCSNKCRHYARLASGVDDLDRPCEKCGTLFRINRYSKRRFCSHTCSGVGKYKR